MVRCEMIEQLMVGWAILGKDSFWLRHVPRSSIFDELQMNLNNKR